MERTERHGFYEQLRGTARRAARLFRYINLECSNRQKKAILQNSVSSMTVTDVHVSIDPSGLKHIWSILAEIKSVLRQ